ncbi:BLUF domain-containing protein [Mangrovitalea sediminis]|uniref:BLUF domain-containing protein n=1 Tax=Mangrovitalea sediminis TaxID=1982043 RepID=UPI000BE4FD08|nr:BLUF domain-containing protein [Mangrovitalea sediminis]
MAFIKLAYISRANFTSFASAQGVEPSVARILATSRKNNLEKGVVGGLYYGNGCFFQYLEGEAETVRKLFDRIKSDNRHRDIQLVLEGPIEEKSFGQWSMKYVPIAGDIDTLLRRHHIATFDPYTFSSTMFSELVDLIHRSGDTPSHVSHTTMTQRPLIGKDPAETMERNFLIAVSAILITGLAVGGWLLL